MHVLNIYLFLIVVISDSCVIAMQDEKFPLAVSYVKFDSCSELKNSLSDEWDIYGVKVARQPHSLGEERSNLRDYTCLHRAETSSRKVIEYLIQDSSGVNLDNRLCNEFKKPFNDVLPFDVFVNPRLYSLIHDENSHDIISQRTCYFNMDPTRLPVAGIYDEAYVSNEEYSAVKKAIDNSGSYTNTEKEDSYLCHNSDYNKLLNCIRNAQKSESYTFSLIFTLFAGIPGVGHGASCVIKKDVHKTTLFCMEGCNFSLRGSSGLYSQKLLYPAIQRLQRFLNNPDVLQKAIERYNRATRLPLHNISCLMIAEPYTIPTISISDYDGSAGMAFAAAELLLHKHFTQAKEDAIAIDAEHRFISTLPVSFNNPLVYALLCHDATGKEVFLVKDNERRNELKKIARSIVFLEQSDNGCFTHESQFNKLLHLHKNGESFAIVTNLNEDKIWNVVFVEKGRVAGVLGNYKQDRLNSICAIVMADTNLLSDIFNQTQYRFLTNEETQSVEFVSSNALQEEAAARLLEDSERREQNIRNTDDSAIDTKEVKPENNQGGWYSTVKLFMSENRLFKIILFSGVTIPLAYFIAKSYQQRQIFSVQQ